MFGLTILPVVLLAQSEKPKGKVKFLSSAIYPPDKNKKIHSFKNTLETWYDTSGRVISEKVFMRFSEKDYLSLSDVIYYDDLGRKVRTIRSSKTNGDSRTKHDTLETTYHFNKQGNLVENYFAEKGKKATITTVYDKAKNIDTMYRDGKANPVKIVRHLNKFRDEEISFYQGVNEFVSDSRPFITDTSITAHRSIIIYDDRHNKTNEIFFKKNGDRGSHESYIYDANNNLLKYIDSNRIYIGGAPKNPEKAPYSASRTYLYKKFDRSGNWQQQYALIDDKFILITRRKLTYYP